MRLKDFWATLVRRWYLVLTAIVVTVGATFCVLQLVGPTYEAEGSVLVFPPVATVQRETESQTQGNPYLVLNGVSQARDIVIRALTSKAVQDELAEENPGSSFEATPDFTNSAPIILITAEASSADDAIKALAAAMDRVPLVLNDLQAGLNLPSDTLITSRKLLADPQPDAVHKDQIRAGIVAGVVAFGLCLLLIGLLDGLLTKLNRKAGKGPRQFEGADAEPDGRVIPASRQNQTKSRRLAPRAPVTPRSGQQPASPGGVGPRSGDDAHRRLQSVAEGEDPVSIVRTAQGR